MQKRHNIEMTNCREEKIQNRKNFRRGKMQKTQNAEMTKCKIDTI